MSGLANIAAARGIDLDEVTATVEGDINLLGILGLDDDVRNGYEAIRVVFHVKGDAEAEKLAALVEQSRRRSAVFDVVTNGVPVVDRRRLGLTDSPRPARRFMTGRVGSVRPTRRAAPARHRRRARPAPAPRLTR